MSDDVELWGWGARTGGVVTRPPGGNANPAAECTVVTSRASSLDKSGSSPGTALAIMVLPAPGGPASRRW